jgi:hypothetical protein
MREWRAFAVRPTIPDNEGKTAAATLATLGVSIDTLERADIWIFETSDEPESGAAELERAVRADETIFNPNKHALEALTSVKPGIGEVWVESDLPVKLPAARWGGRRVRRLAAWRLRTAAGAPAAREVVIAAAEKLLCNAAYQRSIFAQ